MYPCSITCVRVWTTLMLGFASSTYAADVTFTLTGRQEVPSATTAATGTGRFKDDDVEKSISGNVEKTGVIGVAARLHLAAMGKNGPAFLTLTRASDSEWRIPFGARLTDAQYAAFKSGALYVNVRSTAHKEGEIRGQLWP